MLLLALNLTQPQQAMITLGMVVAVFVLLTITSWSADVILILSVLILTLLGILTPDQALGGLANESMVTVAVLFIVGAGVNETGAIHWIAQQVLGRPKTAQRAIARMMLPTMSLSAFVNNTPLVAIMIPVLSEWAKQLRISPSKLMLPLSYGAILGGTCTLIGTSTNLVVDGQLRKHLASIGEAPHGFNLFDIAWVGVPAALLGCVYLVVVSRWLLPDRKPARSQLDDPREYTVEMLVAADSVMIGQTIEQAGLRHLPGMYLVEIDREGMVLAAVSPDEKLRAGDRLVFVGVVEGVVDLQRMRGLVPATDQVFKLNAPRSTRCLTEAVVSYTCPLLGKSIREGRFRSHYNAAVLAVARNGERLRQKIGDIVLRPGDTLLLESHPSFFEEHKNKRDFFLVSRLDDYTPPRHDRAPYALMIMFGMILLAALGVFSMFKAAFLAASLMIASRCTSIEAARRSIELPTLLAIAASFGLGIALDTTGVAKQIADHVISFAGGDPVWSLAIIYLITLVATELITNNAAAALMFPFAIRTAADLDVNYAPFLIAIMMAASNGFATPIGYQTNLMVYGPGGYRFSDYVKIGVPLDLIVFVVSIVVIPWAFPFQPLP